MCTKWTTREKVTAIRWDGRPGEADEEPQRTNAIKQVKVPPSLTHTHT